MNLLAKAPQIVCDREYPYENRYLSYYAKLSSILKGRRSDERFTSEHLYNFEDSIFGPFPWISQMGDEDLDWLPIFWGSFSCRTKKRNPAANFYAEKAPVWLTPIVRRSLPCSVIHLFRDPRDVYLSANASMKKRSYHSFHRNAGHTDLDHARNLGLELVNYFENFLWDRMQETGGILLRYGDLLVDPEPFELWLRRWDSHPKPMELSSTSKSTERRRPSLRQLAAGGMKTFLPMCAGSSSDIWVAR
jgi:hypothetical protein